MESMKDDRQIAWYVIISATALFLMSIYGEKIDHYFQEKKIDDIPVGAYYQFSFDFDRPPEDPFKELKIDTVRVIDKKDGWVLIRFNKGYQQSMKATIFLDLSKPINQH